MGTFGAHALSGSAFILFGVWWTIQMFNRYYLSLQRNIRFRSTLTYQCTCLCGKLQEWPIESVIKLAFASLVFFQDIITGFRNGQFVFLGNGQHATINIFFALSGCIEIFLYFKAQLFPKSLDYVVTLLTLGVEGFLLKFHVHGRKDLDVLLHTLLVYAICISLIAVCLEIRYRTSLLAALGRPYGFFLQGTWLWQIAFVLYNPIPGAEKWKGDDHNELMIVIMFFSWHVGAVLLAILVIGGFVAYFHKKFNNDIILEIGEASEQLLQKRGMDG